MHLMAPAGQGSMGNTQTETRILDHLRKLSKEGQDPPHIEQLARELNISRVTVARYVQSLESAGAIHVVVRGTMKIVKLGGAK